MTYLRLLLVSLSWLASTFYAQSPVANFTASPLTVCVGQNVSFTNTSSANGLGCTVPLTLSFTNTSSQGANFTQAWNFGNSQTSSQFTPPSITYNAQGTFQVVLNVTNTNTGCVNSQTQAIVVSNFQAGITAPSIGCVGQPIPIQDNSTAGANAWNWNFGDPASGSSAAPRQLSPARRVLAQARLCANGGRGRTVYLGGCG